jgi:hypothetical protein
MKRILYFMVAGCLFYSCSSTPKEREVTVSDVEITGTLKDFVKVIDGTYQFSNNGKEAFITVKFELVGKPNQDLCRKKHPEDIRLNPICKNGTVVETGVFGFTASRTEMTKLKELLNKGKEGDTKSISFKWNYFGQDKNQGKLIFKEGSTFEIIDNTFDYCSNISNSDLHWDDGYNSNVSAESEYVEMDDEPGEEVASESGNNYDALLDSYEKYVDQYIKYLKKINDGDMSVMTEYAKLLEKTTDLANKMEKAKGQLTSKQMKRYLDITNKFTKGIVDIAQ